MDRKKSILIIALTIIIVIISVIVINNNKKQYSIDALVDDYDLSDVNVENEYLDYLKEYIYPIKLRDYIENNFVPTSLLGGKDNGNDMIVLMKEIGYEILFNSMFNGKRENFDDCPVTNNFKQKFSINLFEYFELNKCDDAEVNCLLNSHNKDLVVEIFGNFKNTEPTYHVTHHFKYNLDTEGNVDDIIFEYTEK